MTNNSFGKALGALILEKRRVQGLSQLQLSEDAFGTSAKVRRISELETGQVSNPHPKTIDPIIATLGITDEEIEACARATNTNVDPDLDRAYREARNLIDALAYQFDHARPDASLSELEDFLRAKAKEWRQLQTRVEQIGAADAELERLKTEANAALRDGEFEQVDELLARIEESFQQQHTLAEISKQAEIRVTRGDTCMMREDPDGALAHYLQAARIFQPFDEEETVRILYDNAHKMYESGLRTLRPRFQVGVRLLEEMLQLNPVKADPVRETRTHYQLGLILRNAAGQQAGGEKRRLLESGLEHARRAASQIVSAGDAFQLVSSKIALANCLLDKGASYGDRSDLDEALATLASARVIALEEPDANSLLCHASNGLGLTTLAVEQLTGVRLSDTRVRDILAHFNEAIENAEKHFNLDVWGGTRINRARLFERQARQPERPIGELIFLRIQAISDYQASIETYPETIFPLRFAQAHFELANILFQHGLTVDRSQDEVYLVRAIQSYEIASVILESEAALGRWAECQMYIGSVFAHHAHLDGIQTKEHDFNEALQRFEAALKVFRQEGREEECSSCERSIARLREELGLASHTVRPKY
jgi:tetratricopeptide (TPR) repeat protein